MRYFINSLVRLTLCFGLLGGIYGATPPPAEEQITLQFPNNPIGDVLAIYEKLTGKILVRDANLTGPNLNIVAAQPMPKSEAIRLIEAALLLNGYSLVPDSDNHVKIINSTGGKNPRSEGVPLFANSSAIPQDNQVISYFMQFRFLASADARNIFQQHVVLHPYGSIIEVPNAQALVIRATMAMGAVTNPDTFSLPALVHELTTSCAGRTGSSGPADWHRRSRNPQRRCRGADPD